MNIVCEFVPQLLFLLAMFGYLNALIFAKWLVFTAEDSYFAPSLLIGMYFALIYLFALLMCNFHHRDSGPMVVHKKT